MAHLHTVISQSRCKWECLFLNTNEPRISIPGIIAMPIVIVEYICFRWWIWNFTLENWECIMVNQSLRRVQGFLFVYLYNCFTQLEKGFPILCCRTSFINSIVSVSNTPLPRRNQTTPINTIPRLGFILLYNQFNW